MPLFLIQLEIMSFMSIENRSYFENLRALGLFSSFCLSFGLNEHLKKQRTTGLAYEINYKQWLDYIFLDLPCSNQ